jgi:hypothetical protein
MSKKVLETKALVSAKKGSVSKKVIGVVVILLN